jgi:hypothetical protein
LESTDAVGDANVIVTLDPNWNIDMTAVNYLGATGPVHTYAEYSSDGVHKGLIIYNGFDKDYEGWWEPANTLTKIFLLELKQPFNPSCLGGTVTVVGISLNPLTADNPIGTTHTVTARVADQLGRGIPGITVNFTVTSGSNAGTTGSGTTDADGNVSFTYTSNGTAGTDTIVASFTDTSGAMVKSREVTKNWVGCAPPEASCTPSQKVSNNPRYYRELVGKSDCYAAAELQLFVGDSATPSFKAGPFASGDVIRICKGAKATTKPGSYGVAAIITVKGQGQVWAVDPLGTVSVVVTCS